MTYPPYQPHPAYPPYAVRPPMSPSDERTWAMMAHLAPFAGSVVGLPVVGPLVVYLVYKDRSVFVRRHAAASLNFQILLLIVMMVWALIAIPLVVLTVGLGIIPVVLFALVVWIGSIVLQVIAAMAANRGQDYQYPLTPTMVS